MRRLALPTILAAVGIAGIIGAMIWFRPAQPDGSERLDARSSHDREPLAQNKIVLDNSTLADAGVALAGQYTGEIRDSNRLEDLRKAIDMRGRTGIAALEAELADLSPAAGGQDLGAAMLHFKIAKLLIYEGRLEEAAASLEKSVAVGVPAGMPSQIRHHLTALFGVIALRRGEIENCIQCVGPASCIFPIEPAAIHSQPGGSREAIRHFTEYLEISPDDLRVRWLLNLAYMTLGEYPDKVPPRHLVPLDTFVSQVDIGRFSNAAPLVGLTGRGPNQAGGSVFDDFTGDGLPDLFVTSLDVDRGAALYVNRGDGTFADCSDEAGLQDQVYVLNVVRADFDNDGNLDVILLRGGWDKPMRLSLLRNVGNGKFEDLTISAGLAQPISSESAAWGDYDNDGLVDLFVCGEYREAFPAGKEAAPDPRNRCRLYHNEGQGKFVDVAAQVGVAEQQCSKGSAWGDYDGDGRLDLYVSNINAPCRLYHQEPNGTFRDVAPELRVTGPEHGFACWFWDYDNDGRLDLYVNDYTTSLAEQVATALQSPLPPPSRPRLYRNLGVAGFEEVTRNVGLDRGMMPMGCNFADIDNDGFLDFYLGTGRMSLEVLVPNLMFHNDAGRHFDDITLSSGTGHLQKGHGVSFADWDCDGDLDLFVVAGGAAPGDKSYNVLFQNPGHGRHWLKVRLVGVKSNRAALGARITAVVQGADGQRRSIHRTVGNNSSFGGNSLVESIGLLDVARVAELNVFWPASHTSQTFSDVAADQAIEITEGVDELRPLPQPRLPAAQ